MREVHSSLGCDGYLRRSDGRPRDQRKHERAGCEFISPSRRHGHLFLLPNLLHHAHPSHRHALCELEHLARSR